MTLNSKSNVCLFFFFLLTHSEEQQVTPENYDDIITVGLRPCGTDLFILIVSTSVNAIDLCFNYVKFSFEISNFVYGCV